MERAWLRSRPTVYWLVPPPELVKDLRAYIKGGHRVHVDRAAKRWLKLRGCFDDEGEPRKLFLPSLGLELYESMVEAHKGHASKDRTWRNIHSTCVGPSRSFSYWWCSRCPTCNSDKSDPN
ncbi:hypothetical protein OF83DRAFT_1179673 [Amylostereum chailletii]|nr:hypothetical protein OF83DRAFT_1179673 [Amylostereum chailletii]